MVGKALAGSEVVYMDFMRELNQAKISYERLEMIIKRDTSLSLKLLRYLNSAAIGLRNKINSIQRALVLLGESAIRKWGMLVVLTNAGKKQPHELLTICLIRARFCEKIALAEGMTEYELDMFLVGLLSLADAVFQMPMDYVLQHTAVSEDARLALMEDPSAPRETGACSEAGEGVRTGRLGRSGSGDVGFAPDAIGNRGDVLRVDRLGGPVVFDGGVMVARVSHRFQRASI